MVSDEQLEMANLSGSPKPAESTKEPFAVSYLDMFRYADQRDCLLMFIGSLGAIGNGVALPAFSVLFGDLINAFGEGNDLVEEVSDIAIIFAVVGAASFAAFWFQVAFWKFSAINQANRIRRAYMTSILRKNISWYDLHPNQVASFASDMETDCQAIQDALAEKSGNLIQFASMFFGGIIVGFIYGWQLTLVVLAMLPLIGGTSAIMASGISKMSVEGQKAYAKAGAVAMEVLKNIRIVAAFQGEQQEIDHYNEEIEKTMAFNIGKGQYTGLSLGVTHFSVFMAYGISLWYGAKLIRDGTTNPATGDAYEGGDVITVFFAVLLGSFAIGQAAPNFPFIIKGKVAAAKVFKVIDGGDSEDMETGKVIENVKGDIEIRNVSFTYPSRTGTVLKDLSITVSKGETVALVGPSGSGKSTAIALLERFYTPQTGAVFLDGVDIRDLSLKWYRSQIALVSQMPILFRGSIKENIRFGNLEASSEEIVSAAKSANAHDFIMKLEHGYDTVIGGSDSLSGGQKQRIAIARAIVGKPKILLLDEATSALDNQSEAEVQHALEKLMKEHTTIVVAHRLSTIRNATRICVLRDGVLVEQGTHSQLMELGNVYKTLVDAQEMASTQEKRQETISQEAEESALEPQMSSNSIKVEDEGDSGKFSAPSVSLGRVFELARKDMPYIITGCIAAALNGLMFPSVAIVLGEMIAVFFIQDNARQERLSLEYMSYFIALAVGSVLFYFLQFFAFSVVGDRLTYTMRSQAFKALLSQEISWHEMPQNNFAILATRLSSDAENVRAITSDRMGQFVQTFAMLGYALTLAFVFGWQLALSILAIAPLLVIVGIVQFKMMGSGEGSRMASEESSQIASEAVLGIRTMKSLSLETETCKRFVQGILVDEERKRAVATGIGSGSYNLILFWTYAFSFYLGAVYVEEGYMQVDDVFKTFFVIVFSFMTVGQILELGPQAQDAQASINVMFEMIDKKPRMDPFDTLTGTFPDSIEDIGFQSVEFSYPSRPNAKVLKGVSFKVNPGETLAFVGQSGSGKSTIFALVQRFFDSSGGTLTVGDHPIGSVNLAHLRSKMGLVTQEPVLFSRSLRDNVAFGAVKASDERIWEALASANLKSFVEGLEHGLDTMVSASDLSGGQKQRVAIARALIKDPQVLLLDEATSALDNESEKMVQAALDALMKGRTTLVIAHRLSTIRDADRILVLESGSVIESGSHDELIQLNGVYANYVRVGNE